MNESLEQAQLLLAKARDDAFMMGELAKNQSSPSWGIGFHAQQDIEKAIKAVLASHKAASPFTHDLKFLLSLLGSRMIALPPDEQEVLSFLPYGTLLRYETFSGEAGEEDLDRGQAAVVVSNVLQWAEVAIRKRSQA